MACNFNPFSRNFQGKFCNKNHYTAHTHANACFRRVGVCETKKDKKRTRWKWIRIHSTCDSYVYKSIVCSIDEDYFDFRIDRECSIPIDFHYAMALYNFNNWKMEDSTSRLIADERKMRNETEKNVKKTHSKNVEMILQNKCRICCVYAHCALAVTK